MKILIIENDNNDSDNNSDNDDENNNTSDNDENNDNDDSNKIPVDSPHKGPIKLSFDVTFIESKTRVEFPVIWDVIRHVPHVTSIYLRNTVISVLL